MVRIVVPDKANADRLATIAQIAFEGRETQWCAADFLTLAGPPKTAMIVDDSFRDGLLIMQMAADEAEVLNFGVIPSARRRGIGRELLVGAEALASQYNVARIFLEVAVDNAPARALYSSAGFETVGTRTDYYLRPDGSRVDAVVMAKQLAAPEAS